MTLKWILPLVLLGSIYDLSLAKKCAKCNLEVNSHEDYGMTINGDVKFEQEGENSNITITVTANGFNVTSSASSHGFHVHESNNLTVGCNSLGGHYNPHGFNHSMPNATERHVGDLGNVDIAADGTISTTMTDTVVSLYGDYKVLERSIVIHSGEDDLGLGGDEGSRTTGNAGSRWACCIITEEDCSDSAATGLHASIGMASLLALTLLLRNTL